ncbi:MAG: DnaJ domain-containing protein [Desulfopila sp.]|jgi:hypothetical protein|nr:DnaJ domain-containing protein [Desulfopila sp.]
MVAYGIILLFVVLGLIWLILTVPPQKAAAFLMGVGPLLLIVTGGLLVLLQRGFIGVPLMFLGLSWWRRSQARRPVRQRDGQKSTVRAAYLEMELDHDTGEMDGMVLEGRFKGVYLSSLSLEEILSLYEYISSDGDSATLLESYLDRYHPQWRDHADADSSREHQGGAGFSEMTKEEAYQILGVDTGASAEEIHQAWRRLIKGVHPDSGGSAFLAAKINAARDVLLK